MVTQKKGAGIPMAKVDDKPPTGKFKTILSSLGSAKIDKSEILKLLRGYGKDFDSSRVEEKLGIPQREFRKIEKENGSAFYIYPEIGNLEQVVDGLRRGEKIAPAGIEYAIIFVGGSSSVDIVIVDSNKKKVIKRRIYAMGSDGYDGIWTKVATDLDNLQNTANEDRYRFLVEGKGI